MSYRIINGDCCDVMRGMADGSVDSIVCDPPYLIEFMGKEFDRQHKEMDGVNIGQKMQTWHLSWAREALRVLKPGGYILAFGGSRTYHRLACAIEDAGFEVRDQVMWMYGSGFPKNLDVGKAIDKAGGDALAWRAFSQEYAAAVSASRFRHSDIDRALGVKSSSCYWARTDHRGGMPPRHHWERIKELLGLGGEFDSLYDEAEREVVGPRRLPNGRPHEYNIGFGEGEGFKSRAAVCGVTAPVTDAARQWDGWGTALKPAHEPIVLARRPLGEKTVAANVLAHGTGALNIDACKVGSEVVSTHSRGSNGAFPKRPGETSAEESGRKQDQRAGLDHSGREGRWPANVIHDGSDEVEAAFAAFGTKSSNSGKPFKRNSDKFRNAYGAFEGRPAEDGFYGDTGTASRFFMKCPPDDPEFYECESCGIARHISELTRGCPQCGQTMTPLERGEGSRFHYCAKASRADREDGLNELPEVRASDLTGRTERSAGLLMDDGTRPNGKKNPYAGTSGEVRRNTHNTVKPTALMRYLCRLITPSGGTILDPFAGSGSTGRGAILEGFNFIGIEMDAAYADIAERRIAAAAATVQTDLFTRDQISVTEPDDVIKIDGDKMGTVAPDGTIWVGDNKRAYAGIVIVPRDQVPIAERHGWEVVGTENDLVWVRRVGRAAPEREG